MIYILAASHWLGSAVQVEEEDVVAARIWKLATWSNLDTAGATGSSGGIGATLLLQADPSWQLVTSFQASLAGPSAVPARIAIKLNNIFRMCQMRFKCVVCIQNTACARCLHFFHCD